VSLVPALQMLERSSASPALARVLGQVRADVETGSALAGALARHPAHFSALYVAMVHAGESAGILDTMMERLALTLEKNEVLGRRLRSAMTYPMVVTVIALAVLVLLLVLVVPVFEDVFQSLGAPLPWSTRCIDPVKNCSGVIFEGNTDEHTDGRRHQTLDGQAQNSLGHGDYSRQNHGSRGQSIF
jgi:type IV pilus assembly protein PilC